MQVLVRQAGLVTARSSSGEDGSDKVGLPHPCRVQCVPCAASRVAHITSYTLYAWPGERERERERERKKHSADLSHAHTFSLSRQF